VGRCGAQTANDISLSRFSIETESRGQATGFFVKIVPTLKEERSGLKAIATTVGLRAAHGLFVQAIIFV
jgi:hypothetical protein